MIKAVLFDLDGTLYDRDALAEILFEQQYRTFAADLRVGLMLFFTAESARIFLLVAHCMNSQAAFFSLAAEARPSDQIQMLVLMPPGPSGGMA